MINQKKQKNSIINPIYRIFFVIIIVFMVFSIGFLTNKNSLIKSEIKEKEKKLTELEKTIDEELEESKRLENVDTSWRKTIENIEEIARDQLNLIKKDEIILIPNNN